MSVRVAAVASTEGHYGHRRCVARVQLRVLDRSKGVESSELKVSARSVCVYSGGGGGFLP